MAALYKYADNGEKRVIFVYGRGQSLNEDMLSGLPASVSCEVIEDGMVLCFPFCRVTAAMKNDYGFCSSVMTEPQFEPERCVNCGACIKYCRKKSVEALQRVKFRPQRNAEKCIGCGECVINCPMRAWTRSEQKYYKLTLLGRTGKRNPRLGEDFIKWIDEDSIVKIIVNAYEYVTKYIDPEAPGGKEHIGYIVDRTGFEEFEKFVMLPWN